MNSYLIRIITCQYCNIAFVGSVVPERITGCNCEENISKILLKYFCEDLSEIILKKSPVIKPVINNRVCDF